MAARVCLFYPTASINVNFPAGIALFAFTVKTELTILVMLLKIFVMSESLAACNYV